MPLFCAQCPHAFLLKREFTKAYALCCITCHKRWLCSAVDFYLQWKLFQPSNYSLVLTKCDDCTIILHLSLQFPVCHCGESCLGNLWPNQCSLSVPTCRSYRFDITITCCTLTIHGDMLRYWGELWPYLGVNRHTSFQAWPGTLCFFG